MTRVARIVALAGLMITSPVQVPERSIQREDRRRSSATYSSALSGGVTQFDASFRPSAGAGAVNPTLIGPATVGGPSPTPQGCVGDCDGNGTVTVDEIVTAIQNALAGC